MIHAIAGVPGGGKTTWLKNKAKELLERGVYKKNEIMLTSFTKAAAVKMAQEMGEMIDEEGIGTLHSLALKAMKEIYGERPVIAEDTNIKSAWNAHIRGSNSCWEMSLGDDGNQFGDDLLNKINIYRAECVPFDDWEDEEAKAFYLAWQTFKAENGGMMDFTDIIQFCIEYSVPPPRGYRCAFFDEAQDFTKLQYRLVRQWGELLEEYYVAGDDDQTCYQFQGSDPQDFVSSIEEATNPVILDRSYRLPSEIATAAERLLDTLDIRRPKKIVPVREGGGVISCRATTEHFFPMRRFLFDALEGGQSVMILTTCAYMLTGIITELRNLGLPYHNPYRRRMHSWNPLHPEKGTPIGQRLAKFLAGPNRWTVQDVKDWAAFMFKNGTKAIQRNMGAAIERCDDVRSHALPYLYKWFTPEAMQFFMGMENLSMEERLSWFMEQQTKEGKRSYAFVEAIVQQRGMETLAEEPQIVVGTIHSVKGAEADVVFIFPDISKDAWESLAKGDKRKYYADALDRVFYVGMTRAKDTVYVCDTTRRAHSYTKLRLMKGAKW